MIQKQLSGSRIALLAIVSSSMVLALSASAKASTAYGDLNNFDVFNDTGQECHGFEIEMEDIHSTDITYTFDWNHYGAPTITEDNSIPGHPKVIIRYAARYVSGAFTAHTAVPATAPSPTNGHMCTDISVNIGCEHFGVGHYGTPTAVRHNWLIEDPAAPGTLIKGPPVNVATPNWTYYPPAGGQPAAVQAVILAPPPPPAPVYEFGDAVWMKAIVTVSHNNVPVRLEDLVSDDPDDPIDENWAHGEPDEVEVEWHILQTEFNNPAGANNELAGGEEEMPNGDEVITRRYEFYKYTGPLDPETNEAKCDNYPQISDPADPSYKPECDPAVVAVLGDYIGAQMAGFNVDAVLGLIDHLQDGEQNQPYTPRTVVVGGNTPYVTQVTAGALPPDLTLDSTTGILSGTPSAAGQFTFTITASDADLVQVSQAYTVAIAAPPDLCTGVICTPSDACHVAGVCDPATGSCSDPPAPDGTACDDGEPCTQGDTCSAGMCLAGDPVVCTDDDLCTQDACEGGVCVHRPIAGCCNTDAECADIDDCTRDLCVNHVCTHDAVPGCCHTDAECADTDACTADTCVGGLCDHQAVAGCCSTDGQCDDGDVCTMDACVNHACTHDDVPGCCLADSDCDDQEVCTSDLCVNRRCEHGVIAGCCQVDADCDDADVCTLDSCQGNACRHELTVTCCTTDAACVDTDPCTRDFCDVVASLCVHESLPDCCTTDSDCTDADACTQDACVNHLCEHPPIADCCTTDAECLDEDDCTTDYCLDHVCRHDPASECCESNSDCADDNRCTIDRCVSGVCEHHEIPYCCRTSADCDDGIDCTRDTCWNPPGVCLHAPNHAMCADDVACTRDRCVPWLGCVNRLDDDRCDDGLFCNGEERCDPADGCHPADHLPCPPWSCDERHDRCRRHHGRMP